MQLFIIFFGLPSLGIVLDAFPSAVIAFALNLGAYNAEIFRSAILAVPKGQIEAAYMVGLNYPQTMIRVVMPQAFRIAFPPLFNSLIDLYLPYLGAEHPGEKNGLGKDRGRDAQEAFWTKQGII